MQILNPRILVCLLILGSYLTLQANVSVPSIFGDHMVLQRNQPNPIWGTADVDEEVSVKIDQQTHSTITGKDGKWRVILTPLAAGGPHTLSIKGKNSLHFKDVLVGEVWFCSGQSNMEWPTRDTNHADVELATANNPHIRLITVAKNGTQDYQDNFKGKWQLATGQTIADFSAIGYFFGKRLQNALEIPIGLIDNSWGGASAEAWVPRNVLEKTGTFDDYIKLWTERAAAYSDEIHAKKIAEYRAWEAQGKPPPNMTWPSDPRTNQHQPGNIFNGMVYPLTSYGIRGVIWYQGEANPERAYQYQKLFPLLITTWRHLWQQGDFPFYWVQLADFRTEATEPGDNAWAELREAQTMALSLPNTGEAVIIDTGEAHDVHPRNKRTVADRLVRHALAKDYGFNMASDSPRYTSMHIEGDSIILNFDHVSSDGLRSFDSQEVKGFSIAGDDQKFVWAQAEIIGKNQVKISSSQVGKPVAVRYAWAVNPIANLEDRNGLQVTPFRTDKWQGITEK
ncbi:sialate O-acetylesterase [Coraliomargarita sp. W4R53]